MNFLSRRTHLRSVSALPWAALILLATMWPRKAHGAELSEPDKDSPDHYETHEPGRGRIAHTPRHIPLRGWRDIGWRTIKEITKDRLTIVAGGVTFYTLLAIFPTLAAFVSLYGLVADVSEVSTQIVQLSRILPPGGVEMISEQMMRLATAHESGLSAAFAFSLLLAMWSANAGMGALFDGMNIAYGEAEKRSFIKRKLITLLFTLGAIVLLTVLTIVLIALPLWLSNTFGYGPAQLWWAPFSWVLMIGIVIVAFILLYRFGPSRAVARWAWVWVGAVFAAGLWITGSAAFSLYVARFANYDDAYGPLGTVIGFMVWLWFSAMVVLLGAELNAEIEHQTAIDTTTGAPAPLGARGAEMADTVGMAFTGFNAARVKAREKTVWGKLRKAPPPAPLQ